MLGSNNPAQLGRVLAQSAVAVPLTGSTSETTLATITVPAGAMGANGRIEIATDWSYTSSANNKTIKIKLGATQLYSLSQTTSTGMGTRTSVANRNSASSQRCLTLGHNGSAINVGFATSAIDTSASTDITITGQLVVGTETVTLESYQVLLYPKG